LGRSTVSVTAVFEPLSDTLFELLPATASLTL
jgi:hypothetical protein